MTNYLSSERFRCRVHLFPDIKFSVVAFANTAGTSNIIEQILTFQLMVCREERYDWNKRQVDGNLLNAEFHS